jgi:hypothetical protein
MSNYVKMAAEASDSYFAALTETQDSFLKAMAAFAAWAPPPPPPAFAEFPTMQETVDASFSFGQKFLKGQQEFTEKLIAASTLPIMANASAKSAHVKVRSAGASDLGDPSTTPVSRRAPARD